jgi:hypothetical protein
MIPKPGSITGVGLVQLLLAGSFVVWLALFPDAGRNFAWPVAPRLTAMFIGTAFLARAYLGYHLWRQTLWHRLRWQAWGNYAFLATLFVATLWHVDEMNWKSNIWIAHVWVIAYLAEPVLLPLMEPRGLGRNEPLPEALRRGPILPPLRWLMAAIMVVGVAIGGLLFINPQFASTRWPWPLDPFDARVMAAFPLLATGWAAWVYFAEDWALARLAVIGLALHTTSLFALWVVTLGQYDRARPNVWTYGIAFGLLAALLIAGYVRQEAAGRQVRAAAAPSAA